MAPVRFDSVRHKTSSAVRVAAFRDDTNLIALSYDKTVAAEPPIPVLPPRNPLRAAGVRLQQSRPALGRPIIISPPVAPPTEEHPAFRTSSRSSAEDRKRDSGLAPTSPSSTLRDEGDDYLARFKVDDKLKSQYSAETLHMEMVGDDETCASLSPKSVRFGDTTWAADRPAAASNRKPITSTSTIQAMVTTPQSIPEEEPVSCPSSPSSSRSLGRSYSSAAFSIPSRAFLRRSFSLRSFSTPSRRGEVLSLCEDTLPSTLFTAADAMATLPLVSGVPERARKHPLESMVRGLDSPRGTVATPLEPQAAQRSPSALPANQQRQLEERQHQSQPPQPEPSTPRTPTTPKSSPSSRFWLRSNKFVKRSSPTNTDLDDSDTSFCPLKTPIPTDSLLEDDFLTGLSFSKRGSILLGGQRAASFDGTMDSPSDAAQRDTPPRDDMVSDLPSRDAQKDHSTNPPSTTQLAPVAPPTESHIPSADAVAAAASSLTPDIRVLAADVERESEKVRSFYAAGEALNWEDGAPSHTFHEHLEPTLEASAEEDQEHDPSRNHLTPVQSTRRSGSVSSLRHDSARRETELAGGIEDWENIDGANVDRYGFIEPPRISSRPSSRVGTPTSLKSAQFSPRRRNVLQKRDPSDFASPLGAGRAPSRKVSRRSLNTQHSGMSTTSMRSQRSVMRQAGNLLPHNRARRWMDEAGDMLTTSPNLHDIAEEAKMEKISEALKRKEWERSEKWRKMAKNVKKGVQGEGMEFEFDVKNPKLIERTWKGIPDRWRGAAWWSFMAENAKADDKSPSDDSIIADFHRLQQRASPDDVQIDLDVPRTINKHIMFRRRYRGGQRLMFRVLHALSLYFPDTGYVQGMASLAATLLCYFDEEKCFVMLVRMWQLRGLEALYKPGFEGLLAALKDFDGNWLNKEVFEKLAELGIDNTAYGTRWYLTLFNLSIPFAAQLRVWDVFLLMGSTTTDSSTTPSGNGSAPAPAGLDVLHATSAALIQALREIILDSDFENAMKALTSWIPIKDEDMLMKVTKAEWKAHQSKKKG